MNEDAYDTVRGAIITGKTIAGGGAGITTGPTSTTSGDIATFTGTSGQIADSGVLLSSLAPLASPSFTGTVVLANALGVLYGGTGSTTASGARTNLGATGKYAVTFGDGSSTSYTITHNLGTTDVIVGVSFVASPNQVAMCEVQLTSTNTVTLLFATAPTSNSMRAVVIG